MSTILSNLYSIKEGYLRVDDSLRSGETLNDARYLLVSPHDASGEGNELGLNKLPLQVKRFLNHESELLDEYLQQERDVGMNELGAAILKLCPGGVRVSAELNRGLCNMAGVTESLSAIPDIWPLEALNIVRPILEKIHKAMVVDLEIILAGLRPGARIICLHSMDPWGFQQATRAPLSHSTIKEHVAAQGWPTKRKIHRKEDFITGQKGGHQNADLEMYQALQRLFDKNSIPWTINEPYDTNPNYTDFKYMQMYPGRVSNIDITKSRLCKGSAKTFDSRKPKVDPRKIAFMAELHGQVINAITLL